MTRDVFLLRRNRAQHPIAALDSRAGEAYRRVRAMVDLSAGEDRGFRLVTSPRGRAGTTTIVANVGVALASTARPVLIIDGNLYRPRLHSVFGLPNDVGLTSVLSGEASLAQAIQAVPDHPGVRVLTAGWSVLDPAALLSGPAARDAFAAAGDEAAAVFVDGPPLLQVSGSLLLTGLAGGVVVVARAGRTRRPDLASALDLVAHARTRVLGVVLNDARGAMFSEHIVPSGDRGPERPEHAAEPAVPPQEEVELPDATARGVEPRYPPAPDEAFPDLSRAHR